MTDRTTVETIGESIVIKGELSGDVDLVIDGQVEGKINLNRNALTVGEHGKVNAKIVAKRVIVAGEVRGNIIASVRQKTRKRLIPEGISRISSGEVRSDVVVLWVEFPLSAHFGGIFETSTS